MATLHEVDEIVQHEEIDPESVACLPPVLDVPRLTRIQSRLMIARAVANTSPPDRVDYLHSVLCQVGLPRTATTSPVFERRNGCMCIRLEAGQSRNGGQSVAPLLPYGTMPRLLLIDPCSRAVRGRTRVIDVGTSLRRVLGRLGLPKNGGQRGTYASLRRQLLALKSCRLQLGTDFGMSTNYFDMWPHLCDGACDALPSTVELTQRFYDTLVEHAVPIDPRAVAALKHSALALDIYTWLAYRLCRIDRRRGLRLSWQNLLDQFGQEYDDRRNFKRQFRIALRQVCVVYPEGRVEFVAGGLLLQSSPPPIGPRLDVAN